MLTTALGIFAAIIPSARAWPQFVRIVVRKDASGVSVLTWTLVLVNFTVWSVYGIVLGLPVLIFANVMAGVGAAAILVALARYDVCSPWRPLVVSAGAAALTASVFALLGEGFVWACATGIAVCMFLPQVYTIFRSRPTGVSPTTWWLGIVAGITWVAYGASVGEVQIAAPHAVMFPCAIAILWRLYTYDDQAKAVDPELATVDR